VNGRNLEVRFRGPPGFDGLERAAKASAQARFARGQLTVGVQAKRAEAAAAVRVNEAVLSRYPDLAARLTGQGAAPPSAAGLLSLRGVLEAPEDGDDPEARAAVEAAIAASIDQALDALQVSRRREGAQLRPVIAGFVDRIQTLVAAAER